MSRAVVVTGCSSGIGRACALRLAGAGFRVFAGVRRLPDAPAAERIVPLQIDLASSESVTAAGEHVARALAAPQGEPVERAVDGVVLWGVVNNAGVALAGPLETIDLDDVRRVLEVNLLGPLRLVRALLPRLRAARGRVVNVGSGEAFLATPLNGAYCMSKHALEALSESLRLELAPSGVAVSLVEPGQTETPILERTRRQLAQMVERRGDGAADRYERAARARAAMSMRAGMPPDRVAAAVERALTDRAPRARYFVGLDVRGALLLGRFVPARLRDLFFEKILGFPRRP